MLLSPSAQYTYLVGQWFQIVTSYVARVIHSVYFFVHTCITNAPPKLENQAHLLPRMKVMMWNQ